MVSTSSKQSPLDFILQVTGDIENIMSFLQNNKINYNKFKTIKKYNINYQNNETVKTYQRQGITISSNVNRGDYNTSFSYSFTNIISSNVNRGDYNTSFSYSFTNKI